MSQERPPKALVIWIGSPLGRAACTVLATPKAPNTPRRGPCPRGRNIGRWPMPAEPKTSAKVDGNAKRAAMAAIWKTLDRIPERAGGQIFKEIADPLFVHITLPTDNPHHPA